MQNVRQFESTAKFDSSLLLVFLLQEKMLVTYDIINLLVGGQKGCCMIHCLRRLTMLYPIVF